MENKKEKKKKPACKHDYKNAIQVGNVDYQCRLCGKLLNPLEWFLINNFECIDVTVEDKIPVKKGGRIAKNARLELEQKTGKRVVSGNNFKLQPRLASKP